MQHTLVSCHCGGQRTSFPTLDLHVKASCHVAPRQQQCKQPALAVTANALSPNTAICLASQDSKQHAWSFLHVPHHSRPCVCAWLAPTTSLQRVQPRTSGSSGHVLSSGRQSTVAAVAAVDALPRTSANTITSRSETSSTRAVTGLNTGTAASLQRTLTKREVVPGGAISDVEFTRLKSLLQRLERLHHIKPVLPIVAETNIRMLCPECDGGDSQEVSCTLIFGPSFRSAVWNCFRGKCGFKGSCYPQPDKQVLQPSSKLVATASPQQTVPALNPLEVAQQQAPLLTQRPMSLKEKQERAGNHPYLQQRGLKPWLATERFGLRLESGVVLDTGDVDFEGGQPQVVDLLVLPVAAADGEVVNADSVVVAGPPNLVGQRHSKPGQPRPLIGLPDVYDYERRLLKYPTLMIVEDWEDKFSLEQAGYESVVALPCGALEDWDHYKQLRDNAMDEHEDYLTECQRALATKQKLPKKAKKPGVSPQEARAFEYLEASREVLEQAPRIVLALHQTRRSLSLADELARRLGRERCERLRWPESEEEAAPIEEVLFEDDDDDEPDAAEEDEQAEWEEAGEVEDGEAGTEEGEEDGGEGELEVTGNAGIEHGQVAGEEEEVETVQGVVEHGSFDVTLLHAGASGMHDLDVDVGVSTGGLPNHHEADASLSQAVHVRSQAALPSAQGLPPGSTAAEDGVQSERKPGVRSDMVARLERGSEVGWSHGMHSGSEGVVKPGDVGIAGVYGGAGVDHGVQGEHASVEVAGERTDQQDGASEGLQDAAGMEQDGGERVSANAAADTAASLEPEVADTALQEGSDMDQQADEQQQEQQQLPEAHVTADIQCTAQQEACVKRELELKAIRQGYQPGFRYSANHVLLEDGPWALRWLAEHAAEECELVGLSNFSSVWRQVFDLYDHRDMDALGVSTTWPGLEGLYSVVPGELTIVTGIPNSGKSEWLDALAVRLAENYWWRIAFCSFEKSVKDHARALLEKHLGAPFFEGAYAGRRQRITLEQLRVGMAFVDDFFPLIRAEGETESPTIDWVLEKAKAAVTRYGIRGLVIDPYNELDHSRPPHVNETEYVSSMLSKVKRFAQTYGVHVWLVAHPRQLMEWGGQAPSLYDISGSAHFVNKADAGIVVHRNLDPTPGSNPADVRIIVLKMRNKAAGSTGEYTLQYDRVCGLYNDELEGDAEYIPRAQLSQPHV